MKYHVEKEHPTPCYLQLYEQFRKDITDGVLPFGAKLPSKRLLAEETGTSVITVEHAYSILCDEGYVESLQRSGYFVIYKERDFVSTPESLHSDILTVNHTHTATYEFPYSVLAKVMRKVLLDYNDQILRRSPNHGCIELCTAITAYLARSIGIHVRPEQVIIGAGAEYLYSLIVQLLGTDRIFALEHPCYEKIHQVYCANGVVCDGLKLGKDGINSSELERTSASVLHVTPFNSYPSGVSASASKKNEYLRWAENRNGYIIEDNYESELTVSSKNEDPLFSMSKTGCVLYLNTFSKTIAPAIRVGYLILPEQLLEVFDEKLGFYSCTVPVFEQYVLTELLNNGDFERHINRVRRAKRKNRKTN